MIARFAKTEFVFLFCEPEHDRAAALRATLDEFFATRGGQPAIVKVHVDEATLVEKATELTTIIDQQKKRLTPTFAFIDPFGFSGVPIELISRLLAFDKCEVFFNFMVDFVNRFATAGNVDHHLDEIFGTREYVDAGQYRAGDERRAFLLDLYARQLKEVGGFPYIQRFDMFDQQGHNTYSLFHGTRNLAGVKLMKSAMWAVDPVSGSRFSDREAEPKLDLDIAVDVGPLRAAILNHFAGKSASVEEVEAFTLTETIYSAAHYNRMVLAPLEREGIITVTSSSRAKRFTFPAGTRIQFSAT